MAEQMSASYRFLFIDEGDAVQEIENGKLRTEQSARDHARGMIGTRPGICAIEVWHSDHLVERVNNIAGGLAHPATPVFFVDS